MTATEWAAWVQAFGSIAAVLGTLAVVRLSGKDQDNRTAREAAARRDAQLKAMVNITQHCLGIVEKIRDMTVGLGSLDLKTAFMMRSDIVGAAAPLLQLSNDTYASDAKLLAARAQALASMDIMAQEIGGYIQGMPHGSASVPSLHYMATQMAKNLRAAATEMETVHAAHAAVP